MILNPKSLYCGVAPLDSDEGVALQERDWRRSLGVHRPAPAAQHRQG